MMRYSRDPNKQSVTILRRQYDLIGMLARNETAKPYMTPSKMAVILVDEAIRARGIDPSLNPLTRKPFPAFVKPKPYPVGAVHPYKKHPS